MAIVKISELPAASPLDGTELVPIVQAGQTKRAGLQVLLEGKVDKVAGKGLSTEDYTTAEKTKLSGIASGATANATDAQLRDRATHTGTQAINTIDGLQGALDAKEAAGTAAVAVSSHTAAGDPHPQYTTAAEAAAAAPVQSVAGKTGAVTLAKGDVGLGNVDNTSDANKPVSAATQTALNAKEGTIASGTTSQFWRGDKTWRDFFTDVRAATLTGLSTATSAAVSAADTVLAAIGKLQAQVSTKVSKTGDTMIGQLTLADQTLPITTNNLPTIRPSLLLDFANGRSVDPRIALTRASAATRTNEKGLIETVAANVPRLDFDPVSGACRGLLIEEQRTNLLTYSEQFDNAAWIKIGATIATNVITAPDGTLTADKLVEDTSAGSHRVVAGAYGLANNTVRCLSAFAKSSERNSVTLTINAYSGNYIRATFNLLTGAVTSSAFGKGALASAQAENVGGGYWRLSLAGAPDSTSSTVACDHSIQADGSYTGDGTSGFYIWGTQLEVGAFPTSYIPSSVTFTGRSSTGTYTGSDGLLKTAASGVARYSYNPSNLSVAPALLLEAAATNLLTYSEQFDNAAWTKTNATVTANTTTSPDGSLTAYKLIPTAGATFASAACATIAQSKNATYSGTIYVKADTGFTFAQIVVTAFATNEVLGYINLATGAVSAVNAGAASGANVTAVSAGNSWWRVSVVGTPKVGDATNGISLRVAPATSNSTAVFSAAVADGTSGLYIWGAQLEAGSFPTSYIPTTTAQVTRAADTSTSAAATRTADVASMTGANFSSWYRQDEGTFVAESLLPEAAGAAKALFAANDGTNNNTIQVFQSGGLSQFQVNTGASQQALLSKTNGIEVRCAVAYKSNNFAVSFGGAEVIEDTSGSVPVVNRLILGAITSGTAAKLNGHIRRIAYYPVKLSSSQLQALTS